MQDRLFVAVIGERNAGKSTTWNTLFEHKVKTGKRPRVLGLGEGLWTEVFLISGSNEEKRRYAADLLRDVNCRIVLCSVQYVEQAFERTWNHVFDEGFQIYAQWLNPGYRGEQGFDRLGLVDRLLAHNSVLSVRDGRAKGKGLDERVAEFRQFIHGWAHPRGLVH